MNYGNDKLNEIYNDTWPNLGWAAKKPNIMNHEEMIEEAALQIGKDLMEKHDKAFKELARIERSERILGRYNIFYNTECSGLSHGTPITPEFQQAMALECMLDALRCENLNHEFDVIPTDDVSALIEALYQQGKDYLERVKTIKEQKND